MKIVSYLKRSLCKRSAVKPTVENNLSVVNSGVEVVASVPTTLFSEEPLFTLSVVLKSYLFRANSAIASKRASQSRPLPIPSIDAIRQFPHLYPNLASRKSGELWDYIFSMQSLFPSVFPIHDYIFRDVYDHILTHFVNSEFEDDIQKPTPPVGITLGTGFPLPVQTFKFNVCKELLYHKLINKISPTVVIQPRVPQVPAPAKTIVSAPKMGANHPLLQQAFANCGTRQQRKQLLARFLCANNISRRNILNNNAKVLYIEGIADLYLK
jgi:hypothetical protein